jgi:dimethylsulfone monooxygenase
MRTSTWAPSTAVRANLFVPGTATPLTERFDASELMASGRGTELKDAVTGSVRALDGVVDALLVPQRWYGTADTGPSSYDVYAMSTLFAAVTEELQIISAVHPGFTLPGVLAKWGATMDRISGGRWAINVTSGWSLTEFGRFGAELVEHDERYARSMEFIDILRLAWTGEPVSYEGRFYSVKDLIIDPAPHGPLEVFQGGQSDAAIEMGAAKSDWMYLNGGSKEKIAGIIETVRRKAADQDRTVRFAVTATPLCRDTDAEAQQVLNGMVDNIDWDLVAKRSKAADSRGMWSDWTNKLAVLDLNEGYTTGLIGSPSTILERVAELEEIGVDMLHLSLSDDHFNQEVLPRIKAPSAVGSGALAGA